jgi:peptide/nickel transport system permease protein
MGYFYLVALWAAVTLNFFIPRMMPGNPVDSLMARLAQRGGQVGPEVRRAFELLLGGASDEPLLTQYWNYLGSMLTGNLGV